MGFHLTPAANQDTHFTNWGLTPTAPEELADFQVGSGPPQVAGDQDRGAAIAVADQAAYEQIANGRPILSPVFRLNWVFDDTESVLRIRMELLEERDRAMADMVAQAPASRVNTIVLQGKRLGKPSDSV